MPENGENDVRDQLISLGERRRKIRDEERAVAAELRPVVRRAVEEGVGVTEIATLSGLTRQGVYHLLHEDD